MKKIGFILMAVLAIVTGLIVGTLNATPVSLDLLWVQLDLPLGLTLLLGFAMGLMTGLGLIYLTRVSPLRLQLRKARAQSKLPRPPDQASANLLQQPSISEPDD